MVYAATSYTRPETTSPPFPLERIEEMTRLMDGDEGAGLTTASIRVGLPWILVKNICDWGRWE
ncbi:MAG TPA: hypothetical protein HA262_02345 [Methanosarcina sp.]|nr:hypothetical protein [Methanosarcina sp.]